MQGKGRMAVFLIVLYVCAKVSFFVLLFKFFQIIFGLVFGAYSCEHTS